MKVVNVDKKGFREINMMFLIFVFLSFAFSVIIYFYYYFFSESSIIKIVFNMMGGVPSIISLKNIPFSILMSAFSKTAPFFGIVWFLISFNKISPVFKVERKTIFLSNFLYPFLYFIYIYITLFCNHEISTSGRFIRIFTVNDFFLLLFFSVVHFIISFLTYSLFLIPFMTYKMSKRGR